MKRKLTYRMAFLATWHIPLVMLLSMFSFSCQPSQVSLSNKPLHQTELIYVGVSNSHIGKIGYQKALHLKKRNPATKPHNWKIRTIVFNQRHRVANLAYMAYSLNIELQVNFMRTKIIPNNSKEDFPSQLMG